MNLILLDDGDFITGEKVCLRGRRRQHVSEILKKTSGSRLRVGRRNGLLGEGEILLCTAEELVLRVWLEAPPPPPLPVTLVLALPRPKMLRRILQSVSALGVKSICLINSARVDKSYWGSPLLQPDKLDEQLAIGLEQGRDTIMPRIRLYPRFRPFAEDVLPVLAQQTTNLVAHPGATTAFPHSPVVPATLAIGPEGGFVPFEIEKFHAGGFTPVHLGERILRVETATSVLLSRYVSI
ncbi:MAG: 16S rRNA (uracil(1498)-N(3))-methyltransferase [Pelovirga sp.]